MCKVPTGRNWRDLQSLAMYGEKKSGGKTKWWQEETYLQISPPPPAAEVLSQLHALVCPFCRFFKIQSQMHLSKRSGPPSASGSCHPASSHPSSYLYYSTLCTAFELFLSTVITLGSWALTFWHESFYGFVIHRFFRTDLLKTRTFLHNHNIQPSET